MRAARLLRFALLSSVAAFVAQAGCSSDESTGSSGHDAGADSALGGAAGASGAGGASGAAGAGGAAGAAGAGGTAGESDAGADATPDADASIDVVSDAPSDTEQDGDAAQGFDAEPVDGSACNAVVQQFSPDAGIHVAACSPIVWSTDPPSSGEHYPIWAAYKSYTKVVPRGFWVHDLEHGAVVIVYNCPTGGASEIAQAQAMIDNLAVDSICTAPVSRRIVMTPDPLLTTKWAASAWGWTLRSDCFESSAFAAFIAAHYAQAPANECANGWDFEADGGFVLPPGCEDAGLDGG